MSLPFTSVAVGRPLFTLAGVPIRISLTFWILALFLVLSWTPILGSPVAASLMVAGLAASILLHELGHALTARRFGIGCPFITLHLLGGVAALDGEAKRPKHEFLIAAAGPATSLVLALVFFGAGLVFQLLLAATTPLFLYLAAANLVLAIFNLLPGLPLDGGRILKAALWARSGDRRKATISAARCGEFLAYAIFFLAFLRLLSPVGGLGAAIWPALMGYFLLTAARQEGRRAYLEGSGHSTRVETLMRLFRMMRTGPMTEPRESRPGWNESTTMTDDEVVRFHDGRELYIKPKGRDHGRDASA